MKGVRMAELKYRLVLHDHEAFLKEARKRKGFQEAYEELEDEYALVRDAADTGGAANHHGLVGERTVRP
jgi:hypothetical protein